MLLAGPWDTQVVTGPASEPVTLAEAKAQCRVDASFTTDDTFITGLITACREYLEAVCGRACLPQTLRQLHSCFPSDGEIQLMRAPVSAVGSVKYLDDADVEQTLAATVYRAELRTTPARVVLRNGESWISVIPRAGAVSVNYTAGYADAGAVPAVAKHAIKLLVAHFYENREATISGTIITELPRGIRDLIWQWRVHWLR